jgi:hypothetical protein
VQGRWRGVTVGLAVGWNRSSPRQSLMAPAGGSGRGRQAREAGSDMRDGLGSYIGDAHSLQARETGGKDRPDTGRGRRHAGSTGRARRGERGAREASSVGFQAPRAGAASGRVALGKM